MSRPKAEIPARETALSRRYLAVVLDWIPVGIRYFADWPVRPDCGHFLGGCHWYGIESVSGALAFAAAASSPEFDPERAGASRDDIAAMALKALRYLCFTHDTGPADCVRPAAGLGRPENFGTKWGERGLGFFRESQCGGTIANMAITAQLLGDRVDAGTWSMLEAIHLDYAGRFAAMAPKNGVYAGHADGGERLDLLRAGIRGVRARRLAAGRRLPGRRRALDAAHGDLPPGCQEPRTLRRRRDPRAPHGYDLHHPSGLHGREPRDGAPELHLLLDRLPGAPGRARRPLREGSASAGAVQPRAHLRRARAHDGRRGLPPPRAGHGLAVPRSGPGLGGACGGGGAVRRPRRRLPRAPRPEDAGGALALEQGAHVRTRDRGVVPRHPGSPRHPGVLHRRPGAHVPHAPAARRRAGRRAGAAGRAEAPRGAGLPALRVRVPPAREGPDVFRVAELHHGAPRAPRGHPHRDPGLVVGAREP